MLRFQISSVATSTQERAGPMNRSGAVLRPFVAAFVTIGLSAGLGVTTLAADSSAERLAVSATVLKEVMDTPDKAIPDDLLKASYCVVIVPGVKSAGLGIGGKYGRGFVLCRQENNAGWGAPAAVRIEGGSIGFQIGV